MKAMIIQLKCYLEPRNNIVIPGSTNVSNGSRYSDLNGYNDNYNVEGFYLGLMDMQISIYKCKVLEGMVLLFLVKK